MRKSSFRNAFLGVLFTLAPTPAQPRDAQETTYWKTGLFDSVLALKKCPEQGVCGEVHWINPKDERVYQYLADPKLKREVERRKPGGQGKPRTEDVQSVCGFNPKMSFAETSPGKWQGKLHLRGLGMTFNTVVTVVSDTEIRIAASKFLFSKNDTWTRVDKNDPRYPKCKAPQRKK